jgi:hypothetical protein
VSDDQQPALHGELEPREDDHRASLDWQGLYVRSATLTNEEVARFLTSLDN